MLAEIDLEFPRREMRNGMDELLMMARSENGMVTERLPLTEKLPQTRRPQEMEIEIESMWMPMTEI